ncbi:MAG: nicotinate-nucleotide--dimethylbenzimidazole phosphoribosyltransferase [Solirubrobacteraceae bacterium]
MTARFPRPPTPAGFDPSRASQRAADPQRWRYDDARLGAVYDVIADRRDIRRFRPDAVGEDVLRRVLAAAHQAPSVGLMQPWRLIVIRSEETRSEIRRLAQRERLRQAERFDERARAFLDQKIEGVVEAPLGVCVCCDHGEPDQEVLGRGTIPETDVYSTACAIQNLWLAARGEGLGIGWVSFYRPADLRALLGLPERVEPIAYLCVGWPDELPVRPTLEAVGWSQRLALDAVVMRERWDGGAALGEEVGIDRSAAIAARDRLDKLVKPAGSLGALEPLIERWALAAGSPPPERVRAGVLVCAGDHGHVHRGTSLFDGRVSAQVAAAAVRGETAIGVLAEHGGHDLLVADVGLRDPTPPGVRDVKVAAGTADMTSGPAVPTRGLLEAAMATGAALARELADHGVDCLVLGEIGIGNTTSAAALTCVLTGYPPEVAVGRGTGLDAAGIARKRAVVADALARHGSRLEALDALQAVGGLELAALAGAAIAAVSLRLPVILDGYAVGAAALAAVRLHPTVGERLIAGHRSAEPGHDIVLTELGLEPLLDLRLRLGEASGALLALPLIEAAGALHRRMGTFEESGVSRSRSPSPAAVGDMKRRTR